MQSVTPEPWTLPGELWLPVPNHEKTHEFSSFGRCHSFDREVECANGQTRTYRARALKGYDTNGYRTFRFSRDTRPIDAHVLVLTMFDRPRPPGCEALHRDGNRANNRLDNLYWGSISDNRQDAVRHGTHVGTGITRCRYGHLFAGPNVLRRWDGPARSKARRCRACLQARSTANYYRRRGVDVDRRALADRKYAELMRGTEWADDAPRIADLPPVPELVEPVDERPTDIPDEDWRPIPGWEHSHEVSDHARVRSISRWVPYNDGREHWHRGKVFHLTFARGYLVTGLPVRKPNGRMGTKTVRVHTLVMLAFHGETPAGLEILHRDGNGFNARLDNLRFGTRGENMLDMIRHGRTARDRQGNNCRWGHALVAPNLMESKLPTKTCLACTRAWYVVRRASYQGVDFQVVADRNFRAIMGMETDEDIAKRTRTVCERGHDLVPSNLVPSRLPNLRCLACHRAYSTTRYAATKGVELDVAAVADQKYAAIMLADAA